MPSGAGDDEKLAVTNGDTPGFLEDLVVAWNASPTFELANDPLVWFEAVAGKFYAYLDWSLDPNYNSSAAQLFGHDSGALVGHWDLVGDSWITITEDADPNWELEFTHTGPVSGETTTTIGDSAMGSGSADSTSFDFTASANAGAYWYVSRVRQSAAGANAQIFYRKNTADSKGHNHNYSGETLDSTTLSFPDVKVAVNASNTANYLENLLEDQTIIGAVLGVDFFTSGTNPNKTIRGKVDLTSLAGYNATGKWALILDNNVLKWYPIDPC